MPDFDIFALGESELTVSGGQQLDGVNQGDGSHLTGLQITLNSSSWQPLAISDSNDSDFRDNDGNQTLNGAQTFDGVTYADGTRIEAEYGLVLTDGTNTWTVVGVNVNNSSPAFGTIEGLAFIGGPGGFPPQGVPLTVQSAFEGPNFDVPEYATPICVVTGTLVQTPKGAVPVETLQDGDLVLTRDDGYQKLQWIGSSDMPAHGAMAPVEIRAGVMGNSRALTVSQQHRVLIEGWPAELFCGSKDVLVPAVKLINGSDVRLREGGIVRYFHLLFKSHQLILTEGIWTESLFPGAKALQHIGAAARADLQQKCPDLDFETSDFVAPTANGTSAHLIATSL